MSTVRIRHPSRKVYLPMGKCSHPNCEREGDEIEADGKLKCARHLSIVIKTPVAQTLRPGQRIGR